MIYKLKSIKPLSFLHDSEFISVTKIQTEIEKINENLDAAGNKL